ncbi:MAG: molybdopterin oxidoreductase, partial [Candidatus Omnitrophota bacterium]|nr:molybdopterin oxidoreductase [Candidatus Omnitrophota bacterium]
VYLTPKYRHSAHTMPVDTDIIAMWFGPFGDPYRKDKRKPWVGEGYVDICPSDAKALGIEDGDYIWVDADPEDRPYHGEKKKGSKEYQLSRLMLRARYYLGIPPTISRSWFHMYGATYGSVEGHLNNKDGLARNPRTGYQAMYRFGSHQSCTRGWLRPTLMTDSMVRKNTIGQVIGKGFAPDVHCPNGAPRESFVKFTKAEDGGINGNKLWRPARLGLRPTYETSVMKKFIKGGFST